MQYKAVRRWRDLTDGHLYEQGDAFPHDGRTIAPVRINELLTGQNAACKQMIEQAEELPAPERKTRRTAKKAEKNEE